MMTSFTRIVVVLAFVRNGIALSKHRPIRYYRPGNLSYIFTMAPVFQDVKAEALDPYLMGL